MSHPLLAEAAALAERGEPFVLATVVWRRGPSSGQPGSKALVLPDGSVQGWLSGACAQPAVRREALSALRDGRSRLVLVGMPDEAATAFDADVVTIPMSCGSEGALAVHLEPVVAPPCVVVVGSSPAVQTLSALVGDLGWRSAVVDGAPALESTDRPMGAGTAVVVATQGDDDEAALEAALATEAGYVGLVASPKRAASVREYLRDRGVSDENLARIQAPAGLDLGSTDHREIAVAVLAELVARRARGELRAVTAAATRPETATDPVCGMDVETATSHWNLERDGHTWYFCCPGCLETFRSDPEDYRTSR